MHDVRVESNLPKGWLPEGAAVRAIARRYSAGHWEAVVPEFTVAGVGDSPEAALVNALELLDDYLCLSASDGLSFEDAIRPLNRRAWFSILREAFGLVVRSKLPRRHDDHDRTSQHYRLPLRPLGAH